MSNFLEIIDDFERKEKIINPRDYFDKFTAHYNNGFEKGLTTGWNEIDNYFCPTKDGKLIIITGIPGHGKSAFLDHLTVNMALNHKYKTAFFSPENLPLVFHLQKLSEIYIGKSFFGNNRMSLEEKTAAQIWIDEHYHFILPDDGWTPENILKYVESAKELKNTNIFVCDPWNEFEHKRPKGYNETEYVSEVLTLFRNFARKHQLWLFLVAHPQKLYKQENGKYPIPTPYDISGSAHFYNKADICLTIHRDFETNEVDLYIQKMRFKFDGKVGKVDLKYDYFTGRYSDSWEVK